ncbi:hypothetical protein GDO81_015303 [Engystomops pustulosus]|uniref:Uncharacterized protein n=1 Tax=Engystomops pustulosus TaxID=76066 RepID=A0AAV7APA2_ENGPU|nr:hypothetical protein GDO81_015303 [Engystomops pustulosus]
MKMGLNYNNGCKGSAVFRGKGRFFYSCISILYNLLNVSYNARRTTCFVCQCDMNNTCKFSIQCEYKSTSMEECQFCIIPKIYGKEFKDSRPNVEGRFFRCLL